MRFFLVALLFTLLPLLSFADENWSSQVIDQFITNDLLQLKSADLNQDGYDDLLPGGRIGNDYDTAFLQWWESHGDGSFTIHNIELDTTRITSYEAADMNGDGEMDLVVNHGVRIGVYLNQGDETFDGQLLGDYDYRTSLVVIDYDSDGDMDILSDVDNGCELLENDGVGSFTASLIFGPNQGTFHTMLAYDVDQDGDIDLIARASVNSTAEVYLFENQNGNFVPHHIAHQNNSPAFVGDLGGDGTTDLLIFYAQYEVLGATRYNYVEGAAEFQMREFFDAPLHLFAGNDMDLDGDLDLLSLGNQYGPLSWHQYDGDQLIATYGVTRLQRDADHLMVHGDFDGDGDQDIAVKENTRDIVWLENPEYRLGVDLTATLDEPNTVNLEWNGLGGSQFQISRNGQDIATTTEPTFTEVLNEYGLYEYTVLELPFSQGDKPSYPARVYQPDPADVVLDEDFENGWPASWILESDNATNTWAVVADSLSGNQSLFIGVTNPDDQTGNGWPFQGRAITPSIDLSGNDHVELTFNHVYRQAWMYNCQVQYSTDDGQTWHHIATYSRGQRNLQHFDVTDQLNSATSVRFSFIAEGNDLYYAWGIDNVIVTVSESPVTLTLTPQNTQIPAEGGTIVFDGHVSSSLPNTLMNLRYWRVVELPDGFPIELPGYVEFNLPAFAEIDALGQTLTIPDYAPAGTYTFIGTIGYPNNVNHQVSSQFQFTKEGTTAAAGFVFDPAAWALTGGFATPEDAPAQSVPTAFALASVYPNPFNPTTTINVTLPETAPLTVRVFDIQGRTVATLADGGSIAAGSHAFSFDGSNVSSGIYFVQATVPGRLNEVRKLMLVK